MHNKKVEFNKLKRKLDLLTVEHRMLTGYLSLVEEAIIQEFRQYINPRCGHKRQCSLPPSRLRANKRHRLSPFQTPSALSPSSSTSTASSPLSTPLHEKLHISFITHSSSV